MRPVEKKNVGDSIVLEDTSMMNTGLIQKHVQFL